jgi:hypothetical protein
MPNIFLLVGKEEEMPTGASDGDRTRYLFITNEVLYR